MALMITDTGDGNRQRLRCPVARGRGLRTEAVFVGGQEGLWHS